MKATEQQLQDIYEKAVSAECAEKQGVEMSSFDLLCALDEAGGVAHFIRSMIETVRAQKVKPVAFIDGNVSPADMDKLIQVITEMEVIRDDMPFGLDETETLTLQAIKFSLNAIQHPAYPEKLPCPVLLEPGLKFGKGIPTSTMLAALQRRADHYAELDAMTPEERQKHEQAIREFKEMVFQPHKTHFTAADRGITEGPLTEGDCSSCGGKGFIDYPEGKSNVDCHACNGTGKK